jgi:hypothetical protein
VLTMTVTGAAAITPAAQTMVDGDEFECTDDGGDDMTPETTVVTCELATLAGGDSADATVTVEAPPAPVTSEGRTNQTVDGDGGSIVIEAQAESAQGDSEPVSETVTVTEDDGNGNGNGNGNGAQRLDVEIIGPPTQPAPNGQQAPMTFTVTNPSPDNVASYILVIFFPEGLIPDGLPVDCQVQSEEGGSTSVVCTGALSADETAQIVIGVTPQGQPGPKEVAAYVWPGDADADDPPDDQATVTVQTGDSNTLSQGGDTRTAARPVPDAGLVTVLPARPQL